MIQITIELATPPPGPPRLNTLRMEYSQLQEGQFDPNKFNATWATGGRNLMFKIWKCNIYIFRNKNCFPEC